MNDRWEQPHRMRPKCLCANSTFRLSCCNDDINMIECSSVEARRLILHRIFAWIALNSDLKTLIILFQNCINLSHSQFGGNITWGGFYSCVKHLVEWNLLKMGKLSSQFRSKCTSLIKKNIAREWQDQKCVILIKTVFDAVKRIGCHITFDEMRMEERKKEPALHSAWH